MRERLLPRKKAAIVEPLSRLAMATQTVVGLVGLGAVSTAASSERSERSLFAAVVEVIGWEAGGGDELPEQLFAQLLPEHIHDRTHHPIRDVGCGQIRRGRVHPPQRSRGAAQ